MCTLFRFTRFVFSHYKQISTHIPKYTLRVRTSENTKNSMPIQCKMYCICFGKWPKIELIQPIPKLKQTNKHMHIHMHMHMHTTWHVHRVYTYTITQHIYSSSILIFSLYTQSSIINTSTLFQFDNWKKIIFSQRIHIVLE